ncbi:hypothetical protein [Pseudaminobacter sp. NGMCC 1.201702]|uniref:hypothetical protein n=1 Tax=Pseudaminobacter sp. NGMCC 1.201702 TaxID=3391825 RepID=UPI0039EF0E16
MASRAETVAINNLVPRGRLLRSMPTVRASIAGAILWAITMGASALFGLTLNAWETPASVRAVTMLFAVGGFLAFPLALFLARFLAEGRHANAAFAAFMVSLAVVTIASTSLIYALQYRSYYAHSHDDAFTITWLLQFVFTMLGSLYQFAVLGLRLFFPIGFAALFVAALWFARYPR